MSDCCGPTQPCCAQGPVIGYQYGPSPYVIGHIDTIVGPVRRVSSALTPADAHGSLRVRLGIRRNDYRVKPGLYALGEPDDTSPVIATANYKLTFDVVRSALPGRDAWLLVLDTRGINVWCAAGKGTFSTTELVRVAREARLEQVVSHSKIIVPQLGATGVAAHEVRAASGFSVVWAPVRADDLPAFLDAGMKATPEMRRVEFPLRDRATLVGVELSVLWSRNTIRGAAAFAVLAAIAVAMQPWLSGPLLLGVTVMVLAAVAGAGVAPLLLPWLPGRTFALKGAIAGAAVLAVSLPLLVGRLALPLYAVGMLVAGTALASYLMMNFTGSSTYTSPSGVEWEMRRAIPLQIVGMVAGVSLTLFAFVRG